MKIEIMAKTAADSGHIDLSDAQFIVAENSGPVPIKMHVKAGVLFLFRGGLDRILVKTPVLQNIGFKFNKTEFEFIHLVFDSIPVNLLEFLSTIDMFQPVFLIMKIEEQKSIPMLIGPGKTWDLAYQIFGVVSMSGNEVILAGKKGTRKKY